MTPFSIFPLSHEGDPALFARKVHHDRTALGFRLGVPAPLQVLCPLTRRTAWPRRRS
jgi:hypothetical protein